jgi:hypothetical protein
LAVFVFEELKNTTKILPKTAPGNLKEQKKQVPGLWALGGSPLHYPLSTVYRR